MLMMAPALFTTASVVVSLRFILELDLVCLGWCRFWLEGAKFGDVGLWFGHGESLNQGPFQDISEGSVDLPLCANRSDDVNE